MMSLSYLYNIGGISNQKLALFGLFNEARNRPGVEIVLPYLLNFDQVRINIEHQLVPIQHIFEIEFIRDLANKYDSRISDRAPTGTFQDGWRYFGLGISELARAQLANVLTPDSFACDFFRALIPVGSLLDMAGKISKIAYQEQSIVTAVQLRLEADWQDHVQNRLGATIGRHENNGVCFEKILLKIANSFGMGADELYVVGDEAHLYQTKEAFQQISRSEFHIDLKWKTDLADDIEISKFSLLEKSIIDFEVAVISRTFVGLSRSTFSGLLCFEKFARSGINVRRHYIYNSFDTGLVERHDNGAFSCVELAKAKDTEGSGCHFYGAQVLEEAGDLQGALELYQLAASDVKLDQELRYLSFHQSGKIEDRLGRPFGVQSVLKAHLGACKFELPRAEAALSAARIYRELGEYSNGFDLLEKVISLDAPVDQIFVEKDIYQWAVADEYAVHASWIGRYWEALHCIFRALASSACPSDQRPRMIANVKFCLERLFEQADRDRRVSPIQPGRVVSISIQEN